MSFINFKNKLSVSPNSTTHNKVNENLDADFPDSSLNFKAFIWHGLFLALASNFMDVNTVIPSLLLNLGASSFHLGLITAIMIGGASFMQLVFSLLLQSAAFKKKWLLLGINLRILMLFFMGALFFFSAALPQALVMFLVYVFISIFAFSGSFANVSYVDIIGKTIIPNHRKKFFSLKQVFNSIGVLISAIAAAYVLKNFDYPHNYFFLFSIAGFLLALATIGFWSLKESKPSGMNLRSLKVFNSRMIHEFKINLNLRYYLFIINTLGAGVSIIPFIILLAKNSFGLSFDKVGDFLIFQTSGMILGSIILFLGAKKIKYQKILYFDIILAIIVLISALYLKNYPQYFSYIFFLSGLFIVSYKIVIEGILIEISNNENRTLYSGIAGAGSIFAMFIPILIGYFLKFFSFEAIFSVVIFIVLIGVVPIFKLKCAK